MSRPYLMVAPNGARRGKADHPALPVTLDETIATASACFAAGADALHLHVRDSEGRHSLDAGRYREALSEMARQVPGMRVQITTESAWIFDVPDQIACLEQVAPGWASVSVREVARAPELADRLYGSASAQGTEIQHILYDLDDLILMQRWQADGIIRPGQNSAILVLGRYGEGQSTPEALQSWLPHLPRGLRWMLCAFGPTEHACLIEAARQGGALRVGFENALLAADGQPHSDNAASVAALLAQLERKAA